MGLLAEAFGSRPRADANWPPWDNRWYVTDISGYVIEGGDAVGVSADTILRCSTVLAAVRFRGDAWAMCPPSTYRKTPKGREELPNHYATRILRNPNPWQTGNRWRHLNGVWLATWGNAYNEIVWAPDLRSIEELCPLHPRVTKVEDQRSDGTLIYSYRAPGKDVRILGQDRVLHFRDIGTDSFSGLPMYQLIRNAVSIALLAERHASTFLRKGNRIAGLIVPANPLTAIQRNELKASVNEDFSGAANTGTLGILPHGVDIKPIASTNREGQFFEMSDGVIGSILRSLGVPGVVVGYMGDKTATYASAKEFYESGGIKHCVLPGLVNVEAEEEKALLPEGSGLQIKHNLDSLLRANAKDRIATLVQAVGGPIETLNEARATEDLPRIDDPAADKVLRPVNMTTEPAVTEEPLGEPKPTPPLRPAPGPPDDDEDDQAALHAPQPPRLAKKPRRNQVAARLRELAEVDARRVVERQEAAVARAAPKFAKNADAWREWVASYFEREAGLMAEALRISPAEATTFCEQQAKLLAEGGLAAASSWQQESVPRLAALIVGPFAEDLVEEEDSAETTIRLPDIILPAIKLPEIRLHAADVHFTAPPPPATTVNVPQAAAPVIHVQVPDVPAPVVQVENKVHVEAPQPAPPPSGPQEMRIVGPVETRIIEAPPPYAEETTVDERDRSGRIKRTTKRPVD